MTLPFSQPIGSFESDASPWSGFSLVSVSGAMRQASREMTLIFPRASMPEIREMGPTPKFWTLMASELARVGIQTTADDAWRYFKD